MIPTPPCVISPSGTHSQRSSAATQTRPENLLRLVREVVADAAADGVVWVQPHFDPHIFPQFGAPQQVMELVLAEGLAAGARRGVGFGVTIGAMRHQGAGSTEELARFAAGYAGQGVCAFGLTGDEAAFPPATFARAFAIAREAGLAAAPHAGELAGPGSVRAAVNDLGATRIAHGVRAVEDPGLLEDLATRNITLDVCLTSNKALGVFPDISRHPRVDRHHGHGRHRHLVRRAGDDHGGILLKRQRYVEVASITHKVTLWPTSQSCRSSSDRTVVVKVRTSCRRAPALVSCGTRTHALASAPGGQTNARAHSTKKLRLSGQPHPDFHARRTSRTGTPWTNAVSVLPIRGGAGVGMAH
jgi:Adenosine deaminase